MWGSAVECLQLLERQLYSVDILCHDQSFLSLCHRRRVVGLSMLYKVNANSNHCLFSEIPSASTRVRHTRAAAAAHPLEFEVSRCRTSHLRGVSCWPRFECGMTLNILCLTPACCMGSRAQSTVGCFIEFCVLQFSVAQVLVGL